MYDQLPGKLKIQGLFCNWRLEERNNHMTKVPYQANGKRANPTDRRCFTDFDTACGNLDGNDGIGIGIFDDIAAIDIDHCVDMGVISDLALDIIETMGCYTEYSPSGNGIRILCTVSNLSYDKAKYFINNQNQSAMYHIQDSHEAIIPLEQFDAVQEEIRRRAEKHSRPHQNKGKYPCM